MSKIYVAGKNLERAKRVMDMLRSAGFEITFDWVADIDNETDPEGKARAERDAVIEADVLVYLWEADQESARYEAGMAMGLRKPMVVSGPHSKRWFLSLPEIECVTSDDDILPVLKNKFIV